MARRGAPKKRKEPVEEWLIRIEKSYAEKFDQKRGSLSRPEFLKLLLDAADVNIAEVMREREEWKQRALKLEKMYIELEDKYIKLEQAYNGVIVEHDALLQENKELKQRIRELERQLRMSARERKAENFREEIHEIIDRYSVNGKMKMRELMKKLGYSGELLKHAKEFLEQWFVDRGKILVSEELGLVVEKDHRFGELAWEVRKLAHSSNPTVMEVVE